MTPQEELEGIQEIVKKTEETFDTNIKVVYPLPENVGKDYFISFDCDKDLFSYLNCKILTFQMNGIQNCFLDYHYFPVRKLD